MKKGAKYNNSCYVVVISLKLVDTVSGIPTISSHSQNEALIKLFM